MRAHLLIESTTAALEALADLEGVTLSWGPSVPGTVDVLVAGRPDAALLEASRRALVIPWTGLPPETRGLLLARRPHLPVYNLHHASAEVAELAVALLLAAARRVVPMDRALRDHDWRPRYAADPGVRLADQRAVVLGGGAIGGRVARALEGLGMEVRVLRRSAGPGLAALPEVLPTAAAVVVCLPSTPATRGLLDAAALALLPARAVLVNVARADLVDEDALYEALASGRLHGAGLDVWWRYPADEASREGTAPSRHPFEALDAVVLSPHRAGHGDAAEAARLQGIAAALRALAAGEEPPHRVDVPAGY